MREGGLLNPLNEAIADLVRDLKDVKGQEKLAETVVRWARNNFQEIGINAIISMDDEIRGGVDLKAFQARRAVMEASLTIARDCAIGEEETLMPWDNSVSHRNTDYSPAFIERKEFPYKELRMSFFCLKRNPRSWYRFQDTPDDWLRKITK